jgi:hypothetical protein
MPSTYRPISIFPLLLSLLFLVLSRKAKLFGVGQRKLLVFYFYGILSSMIISLSVNDNKSAFFDFAVTLTIGVLVFFSASLFLKTKIKEIGFSETLSWLMDLIGKAYYLPLLVGLLESFSLLGFLPHDVDQFLGLFGGFQSSRITITSVEASWASIHMLVAFCAYGYLFFKKRYKRHILAAMISLFLFLYTQSMQGVLVLFVSLIIFSIWYAVSRRSVLKLIKGAIGVAAIAVVIYLVLLAMFSDVDKTYYTDRVLYFTSIDNLIRSDGSSFIRLCYPIIGLLMFRDYPVFGVGGGCFGQFLPEYIYENFPWSMEYAEVAHHVAGLTNPSAVSLFARVFAELGIFGVVLFFIFLVYVLKRIGKIRNDSKHSLMFVLLAIIVLAMQLQFASFAYVSFWLVFGLLDAWESAPSLVRETV